LLRQLQRLGARKAQVLSTRAQVAAHLAKPSWARAEIAVAVDSTLGALEHDRVLVVSAAHYFDARLLKAILAAPAPTVLVARASAPLPLAIVPRAWATDTTPLLAQAQRAAEIGHASVIEIESLDPYVPDLRRNLPPLRFAAPGPEDLASKEALVLGAAQNGTLDLPAKVHAPIETWIVSRLCRTRVTPMQITLATAAVSAVTTVLFARGQLLAGTLLALIVGVLDGVDGKQARVKVETTKLGKREHLLDYVLELSWWTALAYHFNASGQLPGAYALLLLLVGSDVVDRLAKSVAKKHTGRNLDDVAPVDRFVRLIGGRRNIYIWMLAIGVTSGAADKAFVSLCLWGALTAAVHVIRAGMIAIQARRGR
jgi:phosphatidylglycerophosphate synthase